MPFQLSPGVNVTEVDLTTIVPSVATSTGAIGGIFNWGPVNVASLVDSETKLVQMFGKPNSNNAETFFTAANFLSYGNSLYVTRAANVTSNTATIGVKTAYANGSSITVAPLIINDTDYQSKVYTNSQSGALYSTIDAGIQWVARHPGGLYGNSLRISVCDTVNAYSSVLSANGLVAPNGAVLAANVGYDVSANLSLDIGSNTGVLIVTPGANATVANAGTYASGLIANLSVGDVLTIGNTMIGTQKMMISSLGAVTSNATVATANISFVTTYKQATAFTTGGSSNNIFITRAWEFSNIIGAAPITSDYVLQYGNTAAIDTLHVVVVDDNGVFTGAPGAVLESYSNLSRAWDAKTVGGATNYYAQVINDNSMHVRWANDRTSAVSNSAVSVTSGSLSRAYNNAFVGGADGYGESTAPLNILATAYDTFAAAEAIDVSLIMQGKPTGAGTATVNGMSVTNYQLANYIIDNIVEVRKDCIALISPDDALVRANAGQEAVAITNWRGAIHDSSYAVMDSGYKYQYDRYNDVYRWIPCNGDIAGLCVRTDNTRDPWWSPAGYNRGQIKNLAKLRFNPHKADRDLLYSKGVNPVVTFTGQGTVLFGDKTLQSKPSAFDHINVRRLFIVLEKAIATAAKFFLFEFNDAFTQAQFKALVNPYLRDIQGRRGITDYLVVCDATNNTPEVVDANQFIGDIYIKPARSINYIQLNFVAVRTGVQFSEVVGKF
jgi:phage tail sheath protein FI